MAMLKALMIPRCWRRTGFCNVATFAKPDGRSVESCCLKSSRTAGGCSSSASCDSAAERMADLQQFYRNAGIQNGRFGRVLKEHPGIVGITYNEKQFHRIMDILRKIGKDDATVQKLICAAPEVFGLEPAKLKETITCLGALGISNTLLLKIPQLLTVVDLDKRIKFLCAQGLSKKILCSVISTKWPGILFEDMGVLKARIDALNDVAITSKNLQRMVDKYPWFLRSKNTILEQYLPLFKEHGLQGVVRFAQVLSWSPGIVKTAGTISDREEILQRAGLEKGSRNYLSVLSMSLSVRVDWLEQRIERYCRYGFSIDEARKMFIKQPRIILVSDNFLSMKMRFLQQVAKVPRHNLLGSPNYVLYSLEARLKPRFKAIATALSEGLLKHEVAWKAVFYFTDSEFARLSAGTPMPRKKGTPADVAAKEPRKKNSSSSNTGLKKKHSQQENSVVVS